MLIISLPVFAQYKSECYDDGIKLEAGLGLGGSSERQLLANFQLGFYQQGNHLFFNLLRPLSAAVNSTTAAGLRYGINLGKFEPSFGVDYHFKNEQPKFDAERGYKLAAGVAYKPDPLFFAIGTTGRIYYITFIGAFKRK